MKREALDKPKRFAKAWLRAGKTVALRDRDKIIARIVPAAHREGTKVELPDFAARRKKIFGDGVMAGSRSSDRRTRALLTIFVSLYVKDAHSTRADQMLAAGARPWITPLHIAEWAHAIAQQVFRRQMTITEADRVHRELDDDRAAGLWETISVPKSTPDVCADLAAALDLSWECVLLTAYMWPAPLN